MSIVVAVIGVITVLNLALTLGIIRQLRTYRDLLSARPSQPASPAPPGLRLLRPDGEPVGAFETRTPSDEPVTREFFAGGLTLVGAFKHGCEPCEEQLPAFMELAESFPGGRRRVLALLVGDPSDVADKRHRLAPLATVVQERAHGGPVGTALGVRGYPAFGLVDADGVVRASAAEPGDLLLALVEA